MTSKFSSLSRFFFLVLLTLSATQFIQAQNATVFFATDSYEISAVEMAKLDSILAHIDQSQISGIKLVGHTDSRASNAYNIQLSENRVNAVKRYLTSKGVSEFLVTTDFHGESLPVATNKTETGMQTNRRVTIEFDILPTSTAEGATPHPLREEFVKHILEPMQPEKQTFIFYATRENTITGKEGTRVSFPRNAFMDKNGNRVTGSVKVVLEEYYDLPAALSQQLPTISGDEMLLTGGMVNIMAFKNDDTLTLDPQKGMELSFASPENEDFQLFAGNRNDDGNMNWAIAESRRISIGPDSTYAFADGRVPGIARNREISISSKKWNRWIRKGILVKQPVVRPTTTNTFRALKMGWINCDRFLNDPRAKSTKLIVNSDLDKKYMTTVHMVFPRINSVLTLSPRKGGQSYCLPGGGCRMKMPQDAKVYLVGMAYGNDETLFALKTIWTGKNSEENLEFEPKTSEEIKEILSGLKMDFGSLAGR